MAWRRRSGLRILLARGVDREEREEERERQGAEEYPGRAEEGDTAEDPGQDKQGVEIHAAAYESRAEEVVYRPHRDRAPEREAERCNRVTRQEGVEDDGDEDECGADAGDERREECSRAPQDRVGYAEEGESDSREHPLGERGEEVAADDRVDSEAEALEYELLVSGGQAAPGHARRLEPFAGAGRG